VPTCLVINDHDHLASVRSPLLAPILAHGHRHRPDVVRYLRARWMAEGRVPVVEPPADPVLDPQSGASHVPPISTASGTTAPCWYGLSAGQF
jgi:hypothetical protein